MTLTCPFVLASRSPRRKHLLEQIGLAFTVEVSPAEEEIQPHLHPSDIVQDLAHEKAAPVAQKYPDALTLGADTIVVLNDQVLGKPATEEQAHDMLRMLSGNTHTVYTGIALLHPATARLHTTFEATDVTFAELSEDEIWAYIATGSPMDKAGAYGIQDDRGALFISRIDGDYYTVVGLPLHRLYNEIRSHFPDLFLSL